jgi:hypothetical protein
MSDSTAGGTDRSAAEPSFNESRALWAVAARDMLVETARRYQAFVTYQELSAEVQRRTGITTRVPMRHWIGSVLGMVADECLRRGEPQLTSLCVRQDQTVGPGYEYVLKIEGEPTGDLDMHAAEARLECHRYFEAKLPADGGRPTMPPKVASKRERSARQASQPREATLCPTCNTELPASGQCDHCD